MVLAQQLHLLLGVLCPRHRGIPQIIDFISRAKGGMIEPKLLHKIAQILKVTHIFSRLRGGDGYFGR